MLETILFHSDTSKKAVLVTMIAGKRLIRDEEVA